MSPSQMRAPVRFLIQRCMPGVVLALALLAGGCGASAEDPAPTTAPENPTGTPTAAQVAQAEPTPSPTSVPPPPTQTAVEVATSVVVSQPVAATPTSTPALQRSSEGWLGPITFASGELNNDPVDPGDRFESGIVTIYAFFDYEGLIPDDIVGSRWYRGAEEVVSISTALVDVLGRDAGDAGNLHFWATFDDGFDPGTYLVEVSLNGEVVQTGEFVVTLAAAGDAFLGATMFTDEAGPSGPVDTFPDTISHEYPAGTREAYVVLGFDSMPPGITWGWRLAREGVTIDEARNLTWDAGDGRGLYRLTLPLPAGQALYDFELYLSGELIEFASFSVGDPSPPDARLLVEDDFDDPESGWASLDDPAAAIAYADGQYVLSVLSDDRLPVIGAWGETFADGVIEVDATLLAGPEPNAFGLILRYQDERNYHGFLIGSDGYFAAFHNLNGTIIWDRDWTPAKTDVLHFGETTNRLRVLMVGPELRFYANGHLLLILPDAHWDDGLTGVIAASFGGPGVEVGFDRWRVWELSEE